MRNGRLPFIPKRRHNLLHQRMGQHVLRRGFVAPVCNLVIHHRRATTPILSYDCMQSTNRSYTKKLSIAFARLFVLGQSRYRRFHPRQSLLCSRKERLDDASDYSQKPRRVDRSSPAEFESDLNQPLKKRSTWSSEEGGSNGRRSFYLGVTVLLILSYLCLIRGNGAFSIMDATEPKFAIAAREMVEKGDWLTPQWNNRLRFDKPPLIYWLMAIAYKIFGFTEFATRLPSSLAGTFLTVAIYLSGWKFAHLPSKRCRFFTGLVSGIVFLCNLFTVGWSRAGVSDMLLSLHIGTALLCFFAGYSILSVGEEDMISNPLYPWNADLLVSTEEQSMDAGIVKTLGNGEILKQKAKIFYFLFFIFCALAVLTKGPLGAFLPVGIITLFLWFTGNWKQVILHEMPLLWGILSGSLISLPWYILMIRKHGMNFVESFFGYHNINRLTKAVNGHTGPFYYYMPISLVGLTPWIFLVPAVFFFYQPFQRKMWKKRPRYRQFPLFLCTWILFVYAFFSVIRTKLLSYVIPAVPAIALLLGVFIGRLHCLEEESNLTIPKKTKNMITESSSVEKKSYFPSNASNPGKNNEEENHRVRKEWPMLLLEERSRLIFQENSVFLKLFVSLAILWTAMCSIFGFSIVSIAEKATGDPTVLTTCLNLLKIQLFTWRGGIPWLVASVIAFVQLNSKKDGRRYARRIRWLFVPFSAAFISFLMFFVQPAIKVWDNVWQIPLKELSQFASTVTGTPNQQLYMLAYGQCDGDMEGQPSVVWYSHRHWKAQEDPKSFLRTISETTEPDVVALVEHRLWKKIPENCVTSTIQVLSKRGGFSLIRMTPQAAREILTSWETLSRDN